MPTGDFQPSSPFEAQAMEFMRDMRLEIACLAEGIMGNTAKPEQKSIRSVQADHEHRITAMEATEKSRIDKRWVAVMMIAGWFGPKAIEWAQQHLK